MCAKLNKFIHGFPRSAPETKCGQTDDGTDGQTSESTPIPPSQLRRAGDKNVILASSMQGDSDNMSIDLYEKKEANNWIPD